MSTYDWQSLDRLMRPRAVAVVGASPDTSKYPGKVLVNLRRSGFPGNVYPINPKYDEILGFKSYKQIGDLPEPADVALLLVGANNILGVLADVIAAGVRSVILYSSGMAETHEEGARLQAAILQKVKEAGIRMLGPNCLGCIDRDYGTWLCGAAVLGRETLTAGPLAVVSQSGGVMGSMLDRAMAHGIGFTKAIATGNEADINVADCIGYFAGDERTKAISIFAESIRDVPRFMAACRLAADAGKPIVLMKTGRSPRGARVTQGHTAATVGDDSAHDALFRELGVIRVDHFDDLFLIPPAIIGVPRPRGNRVAVIAPTGGLAGLAGDECDKLGLQMAEFSDATHARIRELQAGYGGSFNPLDITGQIVSKETWWQVRHMHELLLGDPNVDLVISGQSAGQNAEQTGIDLVDMAQKADKPLIAFWVGREVNQNGLERLRDAGLPVFEQVDACVRAVDADIRYAEFLRALKAHSPVPLRSSNRPQAERVAQALKAGAADSASDLIATIYKLPQAADIPVKSGIGVLDWTRVDVQLTVDPDIGPYLSIGAPGGRLLHALPPAAFKGAQDLIADWMKLAEANRIDAESTRTALAAIVDAFSQLAVDVTGHTALAKLAFDKAGRLVAAEYAVAPSDETALEQRRRPHYEAA